MEAKKVQEVDDLRQRATDNKVPVEVSMIGATLISYHGTRLFKGNVTLFNAYNY